MLHHRLRHIGIRTNRYTTSPKNSRLLKPNLLARVAQIISVIDVHAGDHRAIVVERVHRIQPAAQPYFKYRHFYFVIDEALHRGEGAKLEIG